MTTPLLTLEIHHSGTIGLLLMILCVLDTYDLVMAYVTRQTRRIRIASCVLFAVSALFLMIASRMIQCLSDGTEPDRFIRVIFMLPATGVIGMMSFIFMLSFWLYLEISTSRQIEITPEALKESFDALPEGICVSAKDGMPVLINRRMKQISYELIGELFRDSRRFEKRLREEPDYPRVTLEDGTMMYFRSSDQVVDGISMVELVGYDITETHALNDEIRIANARMKEVNQRLMEWQKQVQKITRERETVQARRRVHDDVGQALLASRVYLEQPVEERKRDELLSFWKKIRWIVQTDDFPEEEVDEKEQLEKAAQAIGVSILYDGEMPEEAEMRSLVISAMHTCLINTVRHGHGTEMTVRFREREGVQSFIIENNGIAPEEPIEEKGGLGHLRRLAEEQHAIMTVSSHPGFRLQIRKGEDHE